MTWRHKIDEIAYEIRRNGNVVALTGAGMSVESGVPPFTGPGGIWTKYDPEEFGHISTFMCDPAKAWILYKDILDSTLSVRPHEGHYVLAKLEQQGLLTCIVTQNVDGLHQKAGSCKVVEFHGNIRELRCSECEQRYESIVYRECVPPRCSCGNYLRPAFVLYGESIPPGSFAAAKDALMNCRLFLVIGSSCQVYPAAGLPALARSRGARIVEINPNQSEISKNSHSQLRGKAGEVLQSIWNAISEMNGRDSGARNGDFLPNR
jgi:NAD-dependent deacetylase